MRIDNRDMVNNLSRTAQRTNDLGKDAFMGILVTQLQHQDPLKPMDDREFISQMAQFSSLEQMQNLNSKFNELKAIDMLGKYVYAEIRVQGKEPREVHGLAENVRFIDGRIELQVNGEAISVEDVIGVKAQVQKSTESV